MGDLRKCVPIGATLCVLVLAVSATVTQKILNVPVYETSLRWMSKWNSPLFQHVTGYTSIVIYIVTVVLFYPLYKLYGILFLPMNRVKYLGDVGYIPQGRLSMKDIANRVRKQRLVGDLPPIYPNGWFGLIEGFRVKPGEVQNVSVLGKLMIFVDYCCYLVS